MTYNDNDSSTAGGPGGSFASSGTALTPASARPRYKKPKRSMTPYSECRY